jgi:hypothetical protein
MLEIMSWLPPFFNSWFEFDVGPFIWFSMTESLLLAQRPIGTILVLVFLMVYSALTSQGTGLFKKKRGKEVQKNEMD